MKTQASAVTDYNEPMELAKQRVAIVERVMKLPYIKATRDTERGEERFVCRDDVIKAVHDWAVPRGADIIVRPDFKRLGFVIVTATTEHAQKWLGGAGPFSYEVPDWKRSEKQAKSTGFTVQRTV